MSDTLQKIKDEDYSFDMWNDQDFSQVIERYRKRREKLRELAKQQGKENYEPTQDVPPHIRNWFENPVYQMLIKPSRSELSDLFKLSKCFTVVTFLAGLVLLIVALILAFSKPTEPISIASFVLSGIAGILASLFRSATLLRDIATQYAKLQVSISAGMVSVDALQRIVGHQEELTEDKLKTVQGIVEALAPLIKAFEKPSGPD